MTTSSSNMFHRKEEIEKSKPNGMSRTLIPFKRHKNSNKRKFMRQTKR
jgi:hypothetical protein